MKAKDFWLKWSTVSSAPVTWCWVYAVVREFVPYPQWMTVPVVAMSIAGAIGATIFACLTLIAWVDDNMTSKYQHSKD